MIKRLFIRPQKRDDDDDEDWRPKRRTREGSASTSDLTPAEIAERIVAACTPLPDAPPPQSPRIAGSLTPYQLHGVGWVTHRLQRDRVGVILADEMGLGKTRQAIAVIDGILTDAEGTAPAALVVTPLSVVQTWVNELASVAKHLRVLRFIGEREERDAAIASVEAALVGASNVASPSGFALRDFDVVVTTPELLMSEAFFLAKLAFDIVVFDEAHRLKNSQSKLHLTLLQSYAHIDRRLMMTGTPLQNNATELWALLRAANPRIFGSCRFLDDVAATKRADSVLETAEARAALIAITDRLMLRRLKKDVLAHLPPLRELLLHVPLSPLQRKIYRALLTKNASAVLGGDESKASLLNTVIQLRKCCNHPYMFPGVEASPFVAGEHLVLASGKMAFLDKLLVQLRAEGHRVLVFSQFTSMLDILQDIAAMRGWSCERLDGSVRGEERYTAVDTFQSDSDAFLFLLSTRSGGVGLTLTAADTVIMYDSDWNPQVDMQAAQRAHRIGQSKPVTVYRLVSQGTVEDAIVRRALRKMRLAASIVDRTTDALAATACGELELRQLINWSAASVIDGKAPNGLSVAASDEEDAAAWASRVRDLDASRFLSSHVDFGAAVEAAATASGGDSVYEFEGSDWADVVRRGAEALTAAQREVLLGGAAALGKRRTADAAAATTAGGVDDVALVATRKPKATEAERAARMAKAWATSGYTSCAVLLPRDDGDDADGEKAAASIGMAVDGDEDDDGGAEGEDERSLRHITGNVAEPVTASAKPVDGTVPIRVVVVPINNSGTWCAAGVFAAVAAVVPNIGKQYEAAKVNRDLRLGDLHAFPAADVVYALAVVQRETFKTGRSGGDLDWAALDKAMQRVAQLIAASSPSKEARRLATVHFPNIAASPADAYALDKVLQKRLAHTQCFIYHYHRRDKPPPPRRNASAPSTNATSPAAQAAGAKAATVAETPSYSQLASGTFHLHGFGPEHAAEQRAAMRTILLHGGVLANLDAMSPADPHCVIVIPHRTFPPAAPVVELHELGVPVVDPSWIQDRVAQP